jgi:hypothetical protein
MMKLTKENKIGAHSFKCIWRPVKIQKDTL